MAQQDELTYAPAGYWARFVACVIDSFAVQLLCSLLILPLLIVAALFDAVLLDSFEDLFVTLVSIGSYGYGLGFIVSALYYGYFYSRRGATPGKAVMGLKVLHSEVGSFPSFLQAIGREVIGRPLELITCMLGYLLPLFRADRRALHDLVFLTRVVRRTD